MPRLEMDSSAWKRGFAAGLEGDKTCPYGPADPKGLAWSSGWIEGEAKRLARPPAWKADGDHQPTADEVEGMAWWNSMTVAARDRWLGRSATPAEAWEAYKRMIGRAPGGK